MLAYCSSECYANCCWVQQPAPIVVQEVRPVVYYQAIPVTYYYYVPVALPAPVYNPWVRYCY